MWLLLLIGLVGGATLGWIIGVEHAYRLGRSEGYTRGLKESAHDHCEKARD